MQEVPTVSQETEFQHPFLKLTKTGQRIYMALREVAFEVSSRRGYKQLPNQVAFFAPAEIVTCALDIARSTLYRSLSDLKALGLIDQRGRITLPVMVSPAQTALYGL